MIILIKCPSIQADIFFYELGCIENGIAHDTEKMFDMR